MSRTGAHIQEIRTSCVIPAYNALDTIGRALESVFATSGIGEVVVVDDGSTDGTSERVDEIATTAPLPVRLIRQRNAGAAAARNAGIRACSFEWISFLDADDEMLAQSVTSKFEHLAKCPDPDSVVAVYGTFNREGTREADVFGVSYGCVKRNAIGRKRGFPGGVPSFVIRKSAFVKCGYFREDLVTFEDFEFLLRLLKQGGRIVGCQTPGFIRHYTPNSLSRGGSLRSKLYQEWRFLRLAWKSGLIGQVEILRRFARSGLKFVYFRYFS